MQMPGDFWSMTPGMTRRALDERGRVVRQQSIVAAFDALRIKADANSGKRVSLADYFDELLSDDERMEKSSAAMFDALDDEIARAEARAKRDRKD
jgi:hypothetical protein